MKIIINKFLVLEDIKKSDENIEALTNFINQDPSIIL